MKSESRQENLSTREDKFYLSGWDRAEADLEELIERAKENIKTFKRGIQHVTAMRQRGVSFPGDSDPKVDSLTQKSPLSPTFGAKPSVTASQRHSVSEPSEDLDRQAR